MWYLKKQFKPIQGKVLSTIIVLKHMLASLSVPGSCKLRLSSWMSDVQGVCGDLKKNCPGSLRVVPYITSADEHWMSSFIAVRSSKSTKGKFSSQFDWFYLALKAEIRLLHKSFINSLNKIRTVGSYPW